MHTYKTLCLASPDIIIIQGGQWSPSLNGCNYIAISTSEILLSSGVPTLNLIDILILGRGMGYTNVQTSDTYYSWNSDQLSMAWRVALTPSTASTVFCLYPFTSSVVETTFPCLQRDKAFTIPTGSDLGWHFRHAYSTAGTVMELSLLRLSLWHPLTS